MASGRLAVVLILALFGGGFIFPLPQQSPEGIIEVTLTVAGTAEPIAAGIVILEGPISAITPARTNATFYSTIERGAQSNATTDKDGRATFRNLSPGRYLIRAQKDGYLGSPQTASVSPAFSFVSISVQQGQSPQRITLALTRGATISGTITGADGTPVANARVMAVTLAYQNGRQMFLTRANAQTDDRGSYRLFWFGPGEYYIITLATPQGAGALSNTIPATYYPGTIDMAKAKPVTITGAEGLTGIDIMLQPVKTYRVTGRVLNPPERTLANGQTDKTIQSFAYAPRDPNAPDLPLLSTIQNRILSDTGEFDIVGIPPGAWNLFPMIMFASAPRSMGAVQMQYVTGRAAIDITDKDVEGVKIKISSIDVKGRIVMPKKLSSLPAGFSVQSLRLSFQPRESIPTPLAAAVRTSQTPGPKGDFKFSGVPPGKYSVVLSMLPQPLYVADIRVGSRSIFNDGILTLDDEKLDPIQVIIGAEAGSISGTITGITPETTTGQLASTRIVLAPDQPRRQNTMRYRTIVLSSLGGSFYFGSLPPGDYKIFALQGIPQGFELDPEILARYESRGRAVTVASGQTVSGVQVEWIQNAR